MRRWTAGFLAVAAAVGVLAANGARGERPARAQTPAVEIRRVQRAEHGPALTRRRPIFVLVLGSDARPNEAVDRLHADSIHIVSLNPRKKGGAIVGIPRDAYVQLPGRGKARINDAMVYGGPDLQVETVEAVTGIRFDYYMLTSFPGLVNLVNGVGGITVQIPYDMQDSASGSDFAQGPNELSGAEALSFTRNRKSARNGDFGRSFNQGLLIRAALKEMRKDVRDDPVKLLRWMGTGIREIEMDLEFDELFDLATTALSVNPKNVNNAVVPGGVGFAGEASVVFLGGAADEVFADIRDDGLLDDDIEP